MTAQVSIFGRDDKVIVIPQGGGGGGSYDTEPVFEAGEDPLATSAAVADALEVSQRMQGVAQPAWLGSRQSPLLRRLGFKSFKEFYRGATHCYIYEENGDLFLLRFKPSKDGRGFDLDGDLPSKPVDRDRVGSVVVELLRSSPRMPKA